MKEDISKLTKDGYKQAFRELENKFSEKDKKMLQVNYEATNFTITAKMLAKKMNYANFNAANLRYGKLAGLLCNYFDMNPKVNLEILVYFSKINNEWHWTLKENVIKALRELNWFDNKNVSDIKNEIEEYIFSEIPDKTTKEAIIQSRVGQGIFRSKLISYWKGCSVTGVKNFNILRASHIKPWRYSTNEERLNSFNGLLLLPNLDVLFDTGLISFDDNGYILISSQLKKQEREILGISSSMKLRKIDELHKKFLEFHRAKIFKP